MWQYIQSCTKNHVMQAGQHSSSPTTAMPPKAQPDRMIQNCLPSHMCEVVTTTWDAGPLWQRKQAGLDYVSAYCADTYNPEANTFTLMSMDYAFRTSSAYLGRFPGHYLDHIIRLNYMHAWCRDLLFQGKWDDFSRIEKGLEIREGALRLMRYLNRVRDNFIKECKRLLKDSDDNIPLKLRVISFDFYLLALYHGLGYSERDYRSFLSDEVGRAKFAADPIALGMYLKNSTWVMRND
jgi:hypothetical protein